MPVTRPRPVVKPKIVRKGIIKRNISIGPNATLGGKPVFSTEKGAKNYRAFKRAQILKQKGEYDFKLKRGLIKSNQSMGPDIFKSDGKPFGYTTETKANNNRTLRRKLSGQDIKSYNATLNGEGVWSYKGAIRYPPKYSRTKVLEIRFLISEALKKPKITTKILTARGINPKTLRFAGFSYKEIQSIYGEQIADRVFNFNKSKNWF